MHMCSCDSVVYIYMVVHTVQGISERLLEWKGIEATERLANSNNAKVGLPIMQVILRQPLHV